MGNESRGHFSGEKEEILLHSPLEEQLWLSNALGSVLIWNDNQNAEHKYQYVMQREENREELKSMLGQLAMLYKWFKPVSSSNVGTSHVTTEHLKWGQE